MKLEAKTKLVMIGDSITDANRARPIGQGSSTALGTGYVSLVDALISAVMPSLQVQVANTGISGNTVRDLKNRWQTDVLDLRPSWLSIMIGTNDVWRQFDSPDYPQVHPGEYEKTLKDLVTKTRPQLKGLVLMTPFYVETDRAQPMRAKMDEYSAIVKKIAGQTDVIFVDTQAAFDAALKYQNFASLAEDRVHPTLTGHMILATAFLKAVGFSLV